MLSEIMYVRKTLVMVFGLSLHIFLFKVVDIFRFECYCVTFLGFHWRILHASPLSFCFISPRVVVSVSFLLEEEMEGSRVY